MTNYKTLKGFLNMLIKLECYSIEHLKGIEKLSDNKRRLLGALMTGISNDLNEFLDEDYDTYE